MATKVTITHVCDRCGHETKDPLDWRGSKCGYLDLSWCGSVGSKALNGDTGGCTIKGRAWFCQDCLRAFQNFLRQMKPNEQRSPGAGQ